MLLFHLVSFWVQFCNSSLGCMNKIVGEQIGSMISIVQQVGVDECGIGWGKFLLVKVLLNVTHPVSQGRIVIIQERSILILLQYDQLP